MRRNIEMMHSRTRGLLASRDQRNATIGAYERGHVVSRTSAEHALLPPRLARTSRSACAMPSEPWKRLPIHSDDPGTTPADRWYNVPLTKTLRQFAMLRERLAKLQSTPLRALVLMPHR